MHQRRTFQTGQYLAGCRTHGTFARVECDADRWRVIFGVPTMTQAELDCFRSGEIQFAAVLLAECLFFLFRFGDAAWIAAPFEPRAGVEEPLTAREEMQLVFVDSDSGVAQEIRIVMIGKDPAEQIRRKCEALLAIPYDRAVSLKQQAALLRRYPTGEEMLHASDPAPVLILS